MTGAGAGKGRQFVGKQHPVRNNLEAAKSAVCCALWLRTSSQPANLKSYITADFGLFPSLVAAKGPGSLDLHVDEGGIYIGMLSCSSQVAVKYKAPPRGQRP